jgi:hypothetical protein
MRVWNARLIGMPSDPHHFHDHADTVYAKAVKELLAIFGPPLTHSRQLRSIDVEKDFALLGARFALTRQYESLQAAYELAKVTLGHLTVTFIRPALEECLWFTYLATLDRGSAHDVYFALGLNDVLRSAQAVNSERCRCEEWRHAILPLVTAH